MVAKGESLLEKIRPTSVLTIAGFDGGGGAGIQADLKTFAALGCYGLSVVTALTAQNTKGVRAIYDLPEHCFQEQLKAIFDDFQIDAIKIGMLHTPAIISILLEMFRATPHPKIVLDPVMLSKNGKPLIHPTSMCLLQEGLFPHVGLITPNVPEAEALLQRSIRTKKEMELAAVDLLKTGVKAVILKGGHLELDTCDDCLATEGTIQWFSSRRITTKNTHGTGCTFSSAVAAYLAKGKSLVESTGLAKQYLNGCLERAAGLSIGAGNGPLHHFPNAWEPPLSE